MKIMGYRSKDSYRGKTPEARERQLAGLKNASRLGRPPITDPLLKGEGSDPFDPIYKNDIVGFLERHFYIPETRKPVQLELWQKEKIFLPLFELDEKGKRKYSLALIGMPKKNSKSTMGAMAAVYEMFQGPQYGEIIIAANSREQGSWIQFDKIQKAILLNPLLAVECKITDGYIEVLKTHTTVRVVAPNFRTTAGFNPSLTLFDELWAYEKDNARKFYDELTTVPTRAEPLTIIWTYAGFDEDSLLFEIYKKGMEGKDKKMFFFWSHKNLASWISDDYLKTQRKRLRPNTFLRLHENRWTESEEAFIEPDDWDACVHRDHHPLLPNKDIVIMVGIDASVKNDSSAVVAVTKRGNEIVLVAHRKWQPSKKKVMDFEESIEKYVLELAEHYTLKEVRYDPFQMHRSALTLSKQGIRMVEYPQTTERLTEMAQNLYQLIKGRNLVLYEDKEMRAHAMKCVAQETPRGWRIVKKQGSHKIDIVISLSMACFAAIGMNTRKRDWIYIDTPDTELEQIEKAELAELENDQGWEEVKDLAFH
jgi:phage terminase large subunit-like protein